MFKKTVSIDNAKIGYLNFEGREAPYNPKGKRNFCVFLETDQAIKLAEDGWNVKWPKDREDDNSDRKPFITIKVSFLHVPPTIVLITKQGKTRLDESEINILDWCEKKKVQVVFSAYNYEMNGRSGITAYLKALYVTLEEDEFESEYYDVPDITKKSEKFEHAD